MKLHELSTIRKHAKSRVGRGIAAGQGKTAGRGTKGQKSRTGYKAPKRIPGLMSASDYRLPKRRGFKSSRVRPVTLTLAKVDAAFVAGETVSPKTLAEKGVLKFIGKGGVKVLATGQLTKKLTFEGIALTSAAQKAVESLNKKTEKTEEIK